MIDLETLGIEDPAKAPIIQVAAVPFELFGDGPLPGDFRRFVSANSNLKPPFNRQIDLSTICFWLRTNPGLLLKMLDRKGQPLMGALESLAYAFPWETIEGVWANGPTFDISILESAYKQANMRVPWSYRSVRCCRTIFAVARDDQDIWQGGTKTEKELKGQVHDATVDCLRQIRVIQQTHRQRINITGVNYITVGTGGPVQQGESSEEDRSDTA